MKKKQVVLAALVAMVGLSGYFNWSYQHSDNGAALDGDDVELGEARLVSSTVTPDKENFFENCRIEKEQGRSKALESLKSVAENPDSNSESKKEAELKIVDMASRAEKEMAAESEIKAKGFSDAVVYINEGAASVIVKKDTELTAGEAARIQEIIIRIAGTDSEKIGISRYK